MRYTIRTCLFLVAVLLWASQVTAEPAPSEEPATDETPAHADGTPSTGDDESQDDPLEGVEELGEEEIVTVDPDLLHHQRPQSTLLDVHAGLGTTALFAFGTSLVIGSASGNLGKLMDPERCCPDGGDRDQTFRTVDRVLVNTGIVAYLGAASLATYNALVHDPAWDAPRQTHNTHRWLAVAHFTVFAVSMTTGIIMSQSQENDHDRFAKAARVHVASNVVLVPLLSVAFANILFE